MVQELVTVRRPTSEFFFYWYWVSRRVKLPNNNNNDNNNNNNNNDNDDYWWLLLAIATLFPICYLFQLKHLDMNAIVLGKHVRRT